MTVGSWIRHKLASESNCEAQLLGEMEFVLLDIDVTGTDVSKDFAIGLAVLPLIDQRFRLDTLRYCHFSDAREAEAEGAAAYRSILELLAGRTVFTFNPRFVRHMLQQAVGRLQLPLPAADWLDLSAAAHVVAANDLAYWRQEMKRGGRQAHDAVYDVFAMAQLLQAVLAHADETGIATIGDLLHTQDAAAWMRPY